MSGTVIGIAGSQSRPSRTRALVEAAVGKTALRYGLSGAVFDLNDIGPSLGTAARLDDLAPFARAALDTILSAEALVVATPVYKGAYGGLFKHLFDLIDPAALADKPVLLAATGGGARHALVIEHQLRPLFGFFEARTLPTGVYAAGSDFTEGQPTAPALLARLDRAVGQFAPLLSARVTDDERFLAAAE
ncbi:MAG: FMN reductase [Cereibacter sphaeroides]|uniref:FMN reductase n=1 Tax=Cereibacter sphaeroides TaxID=1063 RepID=A0A2W5UQR5_CERSP|nr:MAG: FMN reductase [Cereibacter sphaeroides]